jgi:large subunit ribosomal protein L15
LIRTALKAAGLARGGKDGVRILAKGSLSAKINLSRLPAFPPVRRSSQSKQAGGSRSKF